MKVIFMGTPDIAVPSLKALHEENFRVPLVITRPDKPKGRGNKIQTSPVKDYALQAGLAVSQPERIKGNEEIKELIKSLEPDFFAVAAYGRILPEDILSIPKIAPINVHFSLLPKYRGPAPVNWAIMNGEEFSGVSTMLMDAGLDTGDILLKKETPIKGKNALELSQELAETGAELLIKTLKNFEIIAPLKQDESGVSYAPMMKKEDGLIDWSRPAWEIERMIRAFYPWPAAYSRLDGKTVKFFSASVSQNQGKEKGTVSEIGKDFFAVAAGSGSLIVRDLQIEGRKRMDAQSFLAGFSLKTGAKFE